MPDKDYLTTAQAAEYACVSLTTWKRKARKLGILPIRFMGKKLYRRLDIQRAIEREAGWQHSASAAVLGTWISQRRRASTSTA